MKVYYYYLKASSTDRDTFPGIPYDTPGDQETVLYAFTENKKYAKEFKRQRNMKLFTEVVHEIDDYEDMQAFVNDFLDCYLDYNKFHNMYEKDGIIISKDISILSTNSEYDVISVGSEEYIGRTVFKSDSLDLRNIEFNDEIETALETLDFRYALESVYPSEGLNYDILTVNEFEIFVRFFGNTFRKDLI